MKRSIQIQMLKPSVIQGIVRLQSAQLSPGQEQYLLMLNLMKILLPQLTVGRRGVRMGPDPM